MITATFDASRNIATFTVEGAVTKDDICTAGQAFNDYVNRHDRVPNLVIRADSGPHWQDLAALVAHLKLIRTHRPALDKIALITAHSGFALLSVLTRIFAHVRVRRFSRRHLDEALAWIAAPNGAPGEFRMIEGLPDDVLAVQACGIITEHVFETMLVPRLDDMLKRHDRVKLLLVLGPEFQSYSAHAVWDDLKLGLGHLRGISRIAVVSDLAWLRRAIGLFAPLLPAHIRAFPLAGQDAAREWIKW